MSKVRKFRPPNRLAKVFGDPSGIVASSALKRAADNVAAVRADHLIALGAKIDALRALAPHVGDETKGAQLYTLARDVMADSGGLGMKELSHVALSLCDLMVSGLAGAKLAAVVSVHADALQAIRAPENAGTPQARAVLAGLAQISRLKPPG